MFGKLHFKRIGIFAKKEGNFINETTERLVHFLEQQKAQVCFEEDINKNCDLIVVVGGDGSLLRAARTVVNYNIPILGINRGRLGFLADISPNNFDDELKDILTGNYIEEPRTILNATIVKNSHAQSTHLALNDVTLHHGDIARLIEFAIYIDDDFVIDQRADGILCSTPTGSTAYALSGGGPIVYPTLDLITLLPMFPHTLSSRPIVIGNKSKIRLVMTTNNKIGANVSCDGQTHMSIDIGDEVHIKAHDKQIKLLHPKSYNYYALLREKLGWSININR